MWKPVRVQTGQTLGIAEMDNMSHGHLSTLESKLGQKKIITNPQASIMHQHSVILNKEAKNAY